MCMCTLSTQNGSQKLMFSLYTTVKPECSSNIKNRYADFTDLTVTHLPPGMEDSCPLKRTNHAKQMFKKGGIYTEL